MIYSIIPSSDLDLNWDFYGDISQPRPSIDGSKLLVMFNVLPDGLEGLTQEQVSEIMQTDEWNDEQGIIDGSEVKKLYFSTIEERDSFNAAEAEFAEADPSLPYLEAGKDESGYYLLVDVTKKPSLWQRFKNWF